jgi:hypothetical protein
MNSVTVIDDGRRVRRLAHCDSHDEEAAAGDNNRRNRVDSSPHAPFSTMPLRSRDSYSGVRRSRSHCVVRWFTDVRLLGPGFNQLPGPCAWLLGTALWAGHSQGNHADGGADHFAGDHQFYAAILLATFRGVIGRHGLRFAKSLRRHGRRRNIFFGEVIAD